MAMVHLTIDGVPVSVEEGTTVLKAAHAAGIKIPTLCWLKDINEIGACRMCVMKSPRSGRIEGFSASASFNKA